MYDGSTALEAHLAKLQNCSDYYRWDTRERLCHLKASLDGSAGQVLWQIGENATENDVIQLLKNRFGSLNQAERYRAELKSRRRRPGESIQSVYHDVRRLLALSFPGHSGELCEIIGRDAFLEALVDSTLRIRVLDQQPATLDEALAIVCRMEAYGGTVSTDVNDLGRRKVRTINVDPPAVERNESSVSDRRLHILEEALAEQKRELRQLKAEAAVAERQRASCPWPPPPWRVCHRDNIRSTHPPKRVGLKAPTNVTNRRRLANRRRFQCSRLLRRPTSEVHRLPDSVSSRGSRAVGDQSIVIAAGYVVPPDTGPVNAQPEFHNIRQQGPRPFSKHIVTVSL